LPSQAFYGECQARRQLSAAAYAVLYAVAPPNFYFNIKESHAKHDVEHE